MQEHRERTLATKRELDNKTWNQRTRELDELEGGTAVAIQNQTGNNPTKWDKTGIVLENKTNSKVMIRVDGSRRVAMRNIRFVRQFDPVLRNDTRPEPGRRMAVRQSLAPEDPVHEAPAEIQGGEPDV
jgi:hypothetical protein